jgi:3-isopropylmalate/(R)-2-methylmalate dehydratase small subunit
MESVVPDRLSGRIAWIFGDDFDIDHVIGVKNIKSYDIDHLRSVCMTAFDPDFVSKVRKGDVIVGGRNFGYGHPHYPAMIVLRDVGITAVVAESFAPGYWRGEIYQGMPLITVPGIVDSVNRWDCIHVDWREARVTLPATGQVLEGKPLSERATKVISAGGGYNLLRAEHGKRVGHGKLRS